MIPGMPPEFTINASIRLKTLRRLASSMLILALGFVAGDLWPVTPSSPVAAQTPSRPPIAGSNGFTRQPGGFEPKVSTGNSPNQEKPAQEFPAQNRNPLMQAIRPEPQSPPMDSAASAPLGGKVTVIESRDGRDVAGSGDLIGFSHVDGSGTLVITLVDTQKLWMAVYHVGNSGEIRLASSRAIDADFTLQFNATSPMPDEIRRLQGLPPRQ